ncbi:glutathione S-transferase [Bradyrhizobium sp. CCBAU 051011]|nr:glutathione S-transferase [Bradyrhizobium sp. CCBAU 051011]
MNYDVQVHIGESRGHSSRDSGFATASRPGMTNSKRGVTHMHLPSITATYLAILALLYTVLAVQVGRLRQRDRAAFGDNGSLQLRSAIRAHANFIEYVPIITLMVAMLEMSGLAAVWVHLLMGALLVSRLLHPLGMYAAPNTLQFRIGRVGGITITLVLLLACALTIMARALLGA